VAGSSAGFLFWNLPPARLFLGNLGSSVIAGLASLTVLEHGTRGFEALLQVVLPLSWPLADLVFVTLRRVAHGRAPWHGGRDHTTHELARRIGVSWIWLLALVVAMLGAWWAALL
jgi:UDP-N-acetylmuramyl pentapeptide phosphotransferase/UDP-N-acetylglucosamine-1-phosphate transferase